MKDSSITKFLILAVAIFAASMPLAAEGPEADVWTDCRPTDTCEIEYDHLSNQSAEPFLFLGYVMDSEQARWKQFRKAIRNYPDVQSCLIKEEQKKESPNLLKLDWKRVGYGSGVEVCIFRISRSLGTLDRIQSWMSYHDFRVVGYSRYRSENFVPTRINQPVGNVAGYWTVEQYRERNPTLFWRLFEFDLIYSYEIVLGISDEFKVVGTHVITPTK
ncbi:MULTISPECIES: hypothetical protein [Ruegeria]|uniref:hypothetical protein n=1 Tax=Ruegeria TaxID=97050 RepID=UPI00147C23F6|nr:hypothetical protein [Ruegeria atlantica]